MEVAPLIIILIGSIPITWLSRRSLTRPSSHGFARFFVFEAILILLVLNGPYWFDRPLSIRQMVSWLLLFASIVCVIWGVVMLRHHGGSTPAVADSSLYRWESTRNLVTGGIYRYLRHPMYASLLFLAWGAVLKSVGPGSLVLGVVATIALTFTAKAEERENLTRFGEAYRDYMSHTARFVPFLF